jgi:HEAT repeat protein
VIRYLMGAEQKLAALMKVGATGTVLAGGLWLAFSTAAISPGEAHHDMETSVSEAVQDPAELATEALAEMADSQGEPPADAVSRLLSVKEEVHRMMATGELQVSENAVKALARAPEGDEVDELLEEIAYHAGDPWVRLRGAEALLARRNILGIEALIELLESDTPVFLKAQAAQALGQATGEDIAYDAQGEETGKAQALARWRSWWEAHRGEPLP